MAAVSVAVLIAAVAYAIMNFNPVACQQETTGQYLSADGMRTAIVVVTNCGALSDYNTTVAVRNAGENIQFGDDYVFSVKGFNKVDVVWDPIWSGSYKFTIFHDRFERVFRQAIVWKGDKITYRER
jgi:hypothetical protein